MNKPSIYLNTYCFYISIKTRVWKIYKYFLLCHTRSKLWRLMTLILINTYIWPIIIRMTIYGYHSYTVNINDLLSHSQFSSWRRLAFSWIFFSKPWNFKFQQRRIDSIPLSLFQFKKTPQPNMMKTKVYNPQRCQGNTPWYF